MKHSQIPARLPASEPGLNVLPVVETGQSFEQASQWAIAARPLIKAMFAIEDITFDVRNACDDRTWDEARSILARPQRELCELLDGMRENFICDALPPHPGGLSTDPAEGIAQ
jgi:hypothetical protein